jgi:putative copper export protein/methionine-rich copper-binding protein CopC
LRRPLIVALSLSSLLALSWFPALGRPPLALAHAFVIGSDPADGSTIASSPAVVRLFFNADISSASIGHVSLFTTGSTPSEGQPVDAAPGTVSPTNPRELDIPLLTPGRLPQGSYAVRWTALSSDDGHATSGLIGFNVGHPAAGLSGTPLVGPSTGNALPHMSLQGILAVMWEWLTLLALTCWVGMLVMRALLKGTGEGEPAGKGAQSSVSGGLPEAASAPSRGVEQLGRRARALEWLCLIALLVGECMNLALRAAALSQATSSSGTYPAAVRQLVLETDYGHLWLVRLGLIGIALGYLWWTSPQRHRRGHPVRCVGRSAGALLALAGLILLSRAFSGEAVPSAELHISAVVFEWLFLAAEGIWFGGAASLGFVLIPGLHAQTLARVLRRYRPMLLAAIGALLVSGLFLGEASVSSAQQLLADPYGRALLATILLVALMLLLSGYGLFLLRPVVNAALPAQGTGRPVRGPKGALRFLSLLGAGALLCTALMSFYAPPIVSQGRNAAQAGSPPVDSGPIQTKQVGDLSLRVEVLPARLHTANTVIVSLIENNGNPVTDARVQIAINMVAMDMGAVRETARGGNSTYIAVFGKDEAFSMYGDWTIDVSIQRPQKPPLHVLYVVTLTG